MLLFIHKNCKLVKRAMSGMSVSLLLERKMRIFAYCIFFYTQLWFPASDHDLQWFESDFRCFCEVITGKNIVEEIESIKGAHAERSSPSWICIPQKLIANARDFRNTNSLKWTPFRTDDGFSMSLTEENIYKYCRQDIHLDSIISAIHITLIATSTEMRADIFFNKQNFQKF